MCAGRPRANKSEYDCSNLHVVIYLFFAIVAIMHDSNDAKDAFFKDGVWLLCMTFYASFLTPITLLALCSNSLRSAGVAGNYASSLKVSSVY